MSSFMAKVLPLKGREPARAILVFAAYFIAAEVGLYIFYTFETSPALIWPPVGIALVSTLFWGYRMWPAILLAQFVSFFIQAPHFYPIGAIIAVGFTLQALVGAFALKRFDFDTKTDTLRNTVVLVAVIFVATAVEPIIATLGQMYLGTLTTHPAFNFGRGWGGGIFSALIILPLVVSWFPLEKTKALTRERRQALEILAAMLLLLVVNHLLFSTTYLQVFGIAVIFFIPAVLIWFGLRFHPRWMTLALFFTAVQAVVGTLFFQPTMLPISGQLLSVQIYVGFVAAIFLLFAAVVEERRMAFRRLEKAFASTFAEDQAKNEFIAVLAHELRNPLAPVVSALEYASIQTKNPDIRETLRSAEDHVEMMKRLLDDLLDTVRLTRRKISLRVQRVVLSNAIAQSVASVADFVRKRRHTLRVDEDSEQIILDADPIRLKQMIINILTNACKYTEPGGLIELRTEKRSGYAIIQISDTGTGIDARELPNLFEPFRQTRAAVDRGTGLGIGLFLTKQLTEMHGGKLHVASEGVGKGSTFSVFLPLSERSAHPERYETPRPQRFKGSRARILIVDDNQAAADMLKKLLDHSGHDVRVVYSGAMAVHEAHAFSPHLILLDIGLPDVDGYMVAKRLRASGWEGVLAALSGYGQDSDKQRSAEAGFNYHLVKPIKVFEIQELLTKIGH